MAVHSVSVAGLLVLGVLGLLLLGGLVLTVMLVAHRRTRPLGIALLVAGVLACPVLLAAVWLFAAKGAAHQAQWAEQEAASRAIAEEAAFEASRRIELQAASVTTPEASPDAAAKAQAEKQGRLLPAVGRSIVQSAGELRVSPAPRPARQTTTVIEATAKAIGQSLARDRKRPEPVPAEKLASKPPEEKPTPVTEPDLTTTEVLRADFERWLASRSDAAVAQLRTEFEGWLAAGGHAPPATAPAPAAPRPAWVDAEPGLIDGDYHTKVMVGPYATEEECDEALVPALGQAAADYAEKYLGPGGSRGLRLAPEYLREHLVAQVWEDVQMTDFGPEIGPKPMIRRYALLRFDHKVKDEIRAEHRAAVVEKRLWFVGYGMAGVLGLLGLTFAYLKVSVARHRPSGTET